MHGAWEQLAREIDRANRPLGRATAAVRELARRIAREMRAEGASRDEIRAALTRAVEKRHRALGDERAEIDISAHQALLADVLHCAVAEDLTPSARREALADRAHRK
ncbi:MAG: hypothetical protein JWL95_101 [Gemmatimonadetes bacterium]|nr:hypothetical protein [Gemmatimonadota bacterium]